MLATTRSRDVLVATIVSLAATGCGKSAGLGNGTGGVSNRGGTMATGGSADGTASGGTPSVGGQSTAGSGGQTGTGGPPGGGSSSAGGGGASGGMVDTGGRSGAGGTSALGGTASRDGGTPDVRRGTGGAGFAGTMGTGGARGGTSGTTVGKGGSLGAGGAAAGGSTGTSTVTIDCNAAMPLNGVEHSGNTEGTQGDLAWILWSNGTGHTMTTFDSPAFRMTWGPKSSDVLARIGLDFGDDGLTYDQYGPITAQFTETKSGTAEGYSYIGIYGFTVDPCVELYIIDDSYSAMPVEPWGVSRKGTATIDGSDYNLYSGTQSSTGASSCRGSTWHLFYSVRQTARTCGQISVTQHFDAWKAAGMQLGSLSRVQILAEVGGGPGSIDFPIANVTIGQ